MFQFLQLITGVFSSQLEQPPEVSDVHIATFLLELGKRHFAYASHPHQMELMGHVFTDSLLPIFLERGEDSQEEIKTAWLAFFKFIVFFMQTGFNYVKNKGLN